MLGTRTKQVSSYGRRKRRIINDGHGLFDVEDTKNISTPSGPKELDQTYVVHVSPPMPFHSRRPLSSHSVNVSGRSSLSRPKKKRLSVSSGALIPQSPAIDVDILILDQTGRRVDQERRVSKTNVLVNQRLVLQPGPATHQYPTSVIVVDDDDSPSPQFKRRVKRWPKVMNSSDEEDITESPHRSVTYLNVRKPDINGENQSETTEVTNHLKPQAPRAGLRPTIVGGVAA